MEGKLSGQIQCMRGEASFTFKFHQKPKTLFFPTMGLMLLCLFLSTILGQSWALEATKSELPSQELKFLTRGLLESAKEDAFFEWMRGARMNTQSLDLSSTKQVNQSSPSQARLGLITRGLLPKLVWWLLLSLAPNQFLMTWMPF